MRPPWVPFVSRRFYFGSGRPARTAVLGWRKLSSGTPMSAPVLSGDLRAFPLPDILLMINTNHKAGLLRCMQPGAAKTEEWENGEIVCARSSIPGDRIGAFLLAPEKGTAGQVP